MVKSALPKNEFKITLGGWYQRTTLHLTEIYDFLSRGYSKLNLEKSILAKNLKSLDLEQVSRETGYLEYVQAQTKSGIQIRYYEDGLYILELSSHDIKSLKARKEFLENYFNNKFNPAVTYIFSLGAPTPKVLANIKTTHPIAVNLSSQNTGLFSPKVKEFGEIYGKIVSQNLVVYKTPAYIFIVRDPDTNQQQTRDLTEMQIFFREFKDQLEKYLDIHRKIWEEISEIKEKRYIQRREIDYLRNKLDSYQKSVNLINSRIDQMGAYVRTRQSIAKTLDVESKLSEIFQYKFESLTDTHAYIKELWKMTDAYLSAAIEVVVELKSKSTSEGIKSLTIITAVGVIATISGWVSRDKLPQITQAGLVYIGIMILLTVAANEAINLFFRHKKYKFNFRDRDKEI